MKDSARVLFVAYGGGHIPMVLSVIKELRKLEPRIQIDLLALTTAFEIAKAAGETPLQYANFKHLVDLKFVEHWGKALMPKSRHPSVSDEETRAYVGINFWDLVRQHGQKRAEEIHMQKSRYAYYPINFFKRVLQHLKPAVVVATVSPRSEEAALQAGIELSIPTISITDLFLRSFDPYANRKFYADIVTVIDRSTASVLDAAGVQKDALRITGNPAFDNIKSHGMIEKARVFRETKGWCKKKVVLWAGHADYSEDLSDNTPLLKYPLKVEEVLRMWVQQNEEHALIIRYHPNESHLFPVGAQHPRIHISLSDQHVHEAIVSADVVVVQRSTVGYEAALAGKPVVAMVNSPICIRDKFNYAELGIAYACSTVNELPNMILNSLKSGCVAPELAALPPAGVNIAQMILESSQISS